MRASALVRPVTVQASPAVEARLRVALVDVILAVAAGETGQAETSEDVDSVHAGATVEARAEAGNGEINIKTCSFLLTAGS